MTSNSDRVLTPSSLRRIEADRNVLRRRGAAHARLPKPDHRADQSQGWGRQDHHHHASGAAIAQEGGQVVVLDADEEVSAVRWQQHASADRLQPPFEVVAAERNSLMRQARDLARSGRTVIIDTPPNNREILKSAATVADVVLVPVLPTGLDVDRLATTLELLSDLEAALEHFNYAIVLNRFDARKGMAHDANSALNAHPRLTTVIKSLSAYEKVFGQTPTELSQFRAIWNEIRSAFGEDA